VPLRPDPGQLPGLPPASNPDEEESGISPLAILSFLLRHIRAIVVIPIVIGLLAGAANMLTRRTWSSSASFMPQASAKAGSGMKLAEEFGVDLGTEDKQNSPMFYVALLNSRIILSGIALNKYAFRAGDDSMSGNIIQLYDVEGKTDAIKLDNAITELTRDITVSSDFRTGIVTVNVKARWAPLAKAMLEKVLADVNNFNLRIRQSNAQVERDFVQSQVNEARNDLRASEDRLQEFMLKNREFSGDPRLTAEHDRIVRDLNMRSLRYSTLVQKLDQTAIEAVRTTPVITILARPEIAAKPNSRGTLVRALLAMIVASVIGTLVALGRTYSQSRREAGADDYLEVRALISALWQRIKRLGRAPIPASSDTSYRT
jgi:uncharacterized protein involved in exopolysaccharide biosynthesis